MLNISTWLWTELSRLEIPVAYGRFADDEKVTLPFIIYHFDKKLVASEGDIYFYDYEVNISLYYTHKDINMEEMFREIVYGLKPVAEYEETVLNNHIVTRVTFNILQSEEILNDNYSE